MRPLRTAVVGGSLAGLTAALVLRDLGHEVEVFERSPFALEGLGAGIIVHEPTVRYFVERSAISLDDISITSDRLQYMDRDGSISHSQVSEYRFTAWNSLFRGLESLFDSERYHRAHTLVGFTQDASSVTLRFAEGAEHSCDLAVCADGVHSIARRRLFGVMPAYAGYVGWRGICSRDELSDAAWQALDGRFTYGLGDHEHVVAYPIPTIGSDVTVTGRRINYTWYRNVAAGPQLDELLTDTAGVSRPLSVPAGAVQHRYVAELRTDAQTELPPALGELVIATREPFVTAIVDADAPALAIGRVCLIGDAAITARPHAAAGSAKAAEDAWTLAEVLEGIGPNAVAAALARWQDEALPRGRALLQRTWDMGERLQGEPGAWQPADPSNRFGPSVPPRSRAAV